MIRDLYLTFFEDLLEVIDNSERHAYTDRTKNFSKKTNFNIFILHHYMWYYLVL